MAIHFPSCFSCHTRLPAGWRSGTLCLLIETEQGLVLVDTGPGQDDSGQSGRNPVHPGLAAPGERRMR